MSKQETQLNALFARLKQGDMAARDDIMTLLYGEMRKLAASRMRGEQKAHTLQPTALANEAYLRMLSGLEQVENRAEFFSFAAHAMRHVLVDHARTKKAEKRGGGAVRVTLEHFDGAIQMDIDVLALDEALTDLAALNERAAKVVELKFYGGLTDNDVAEVLGLSFQRVRRDWQLARGWLRNRLQPLES